MMKNLFTSKLTLTALFFTLASLVSAPAFAHGGHLANDSVHGFLHVEHIVALLAAGLAVFLVKQFRGK